MAIFLFLLLIAAIYFIFLVKAKFEEIKFISDSTNNTPVGMYVVDGIRMCNTAAIIGILSLALVIGAYFGG